MATVDTNKPIASRRASVRREREREIVYSNNPDPVGFTLGENKYTASVRLYYDFVMNTIQQLGPGWNMMRS